MHAQVYHGPGRGADQGPTIEVTWVTHGELDEEQESLNAADEAGMQDVFGVQESRVHVTKRDLIECITSLLRLCETSDGKHHSNRPMIGWGGDVVLMIHRIYTGIKTRLVENGQQNINVSQVVLEQWSGCILWGKLCKG